MNEAVELWDRLDLRLRGTSKHVSTLQDSTRYHYKAYEAKVDSIDNSFDKIIYSKYETCKPVPDRVYLS